MLKEMKLVLKYVDEVGYMNDICCYLKYGGYKMLKKVFWFKLRKVGGDVVMF